MNCVNENDANPYFAFFNFSFLPSVTFILYIITYGHFFLSKISQQKLDLGF